MCNLSQIEARLLKSIARFDQGIATVNKKLRKVKFTRKHTKSLIEDYEIRLKNENEDCAGGNKNDFAIYIVFSRSVIILLVKIDADIVEVKLHDLDVKLDENRKNFEVCAQSFFVVS